MDLQLKGRVALVTGGSKGIGASIVRELAREGVQVAICARASDAMSALDREIRAAGGSCLAVPTDVLEPAEIQACVQTVASTWGGLDILVNNVGGAPRFGGFEELSDEDWLQSFDYNLMSIVRFTRAGLPWLRRSGLKRIINITSISALQPGTYNPHYTVTKAAAANLSKHLSVLLAKEQILVNSVAAGPVHSDAWTRNVQRLAEARGVSETEAAERVDREEAAKIPLGEVGEGEHIAAAVALLASPRSSWTTGSTFHVNGGKLSAAL